MHIEWNKVTWYSKLLAVVLAVLIFYVGFKLGYEKKIIQEADSGVMVEEQVPKNTEKVTITTEKIKEENFSGSKPVFSGTNTLVTTARAYVDKTISDFRAEANEAVPALRAEFGEGKPGNPQAMYTIDISAEYLQSSKTTSIFMNVYQYTGGAHGWSVYKVITVSNITGKILSLADVIKSYQQSLFTDLVKKELNVWRVNEPDTGAGMVFPEDVAELQFSNFENWSLDDENLTIYFDQYAIGAGALGGVPFQLPLSKVSKFLSI